MRTHWLNNVMLKGSGKTRLLAGFLMTAAMVLAQGYPQGAPPQGQYPPPQAQVGASGAPGEAAPVDEPGRAVARLGILNGDASIRRGDSTDWVAAAVNAPLMSGDQISVAAGGRAEIQLDPAHFLRIAGDTELRLADLENGHFQVQIAHGLVTWRVLRESQAQPEISTPLVAVHPGPLSLVRIEVAADGTSHITVRKGEADVSTQKGSEKLTENSTMDVRGSMNDPEFQVVAAAARDEWDGWSDQRDSYLARAQAPRYVPQGVSGVEDLDPYGHWAYDPAYGWVWMPTVASSWAPYRDGQWVWEDYYGWTWVDSAPWGWAPFHYGSWYMRAGLGWAWFPGPRVGRAFWRPAMVGFIGWGGGIGVGFGFGNIGWIPLAPFEVYHPWYGRGFGGRGLIGVNMVRNVNVAGSFRNAGVAGGVTGVTAADFQRGNFRSTVAVDRAALGQASVAHGALPVTPTSQNLAFSNRTASVQPARSTTSMASQRFYSTSNASVQRTPFAQQQAAVRASVTGGAAGAGRSAAVPAGPGASAGANWQRFQGTPSAGAARPAGAPGAAVPAPGFNRFNGPQGGARSAPQQGGQYSQPRSYQVSPSIVRPRPESAPQQQAQPSYQSRPQAAPAPAQGGAYGGGRSYAAPAPAPAQRSAPAGGGSRQSSGGSHGGGGHR